jgi:hypothetical protein
MNDLVTIKGLALRLAWVPGVHAFSRWLFHFVVRRAHAEMKRNSTRPVDTWTFTPAERTFIAEEYRKSNNKFREKLGAEGENVQWSEWFAQTLGSAT